MKEVSKIYDCNVETTIETIKQSIIDNLFCNQAKFPQVATRNDYYLALSHYVRDRLLYRWMKSAQTYFTNQSRTAIYMSAEFLIGPQLGNNLINLDMYEQVKEAVAELGLSIYELMDQEEEPGLGNGGLGRLAACYMDSMATCQIPAIGYGIRYEFGIFDQSIRDGWQIEMTDKWLRFGNPWEIPHPEMRYQVKLGGRTEKFYDKDGKFRVNWIPDRIIIGTPFDTPVLGYGVNNANMLRLWKAEACESFDFKAFNIGDYYKAVDEKVSSENITKVLYPNDEPLVGKKLRLEQQYFMISCSLQDMLRIYLQKGKTVNNFSNKYAIQLNDTHPALAVAELMRLLVDEYNTEWDLAWDITTKTFAYTNHTLLPEALEKWPLSLLNTVLPRHLEIIYEINIRFLENVKAKFPGDNGILSRLSLIEEGNEKQVRMANLACVGSHAINGVAKLHSELLKETVLSDFYALWPEKFSNKTNGVTPRRFMVLSNPSLTSLITKSIGKDWIRNLDELKKLEQLSGDISFHDEWQNVKLECKKTLATIIQRITGISVAPESLFDIQVKRIHEYKRQHLNVLNILTLYNRLKKGMLKDICPRTFIFGGKAAPGYYVAKLIIKLINSVAELINNDPDVNGKIKVVFYPDFNVKNAQRIYPAANLSEQISTAGKEASGTGNMKFSLNGALTIGTLDGANVEIREEVGEENFFLFGLTAAEVERVKREGYRPKDIYNSNSELREVIDFIGSGALSHGDRNLFRPIINSLLERDDYMLFADYEYYIKCQEAVNEAYRDTYKWTRMSILNVARMGKFSSDRAINEYAEQIWKIKPINVEM
ncbi:MAG: glycogen/starch/alpha-glucan phosphorylase [Desulfobacterales bacterium]|nr:glycogen/starch/alpha-glucan phosphorylase [Desulfobacterales bacterium]